eukprot:TRINITY_DN6802_c0_g2_i4.p1 TRINITY_DN6802_c0_g2~~TRINITY_DN6802_c0_g2_i4.p1  ORF type:complete len:149 (-),score=23.29 TRINITY_DN6802_c0_g2_i4:514-960(-)
MIPTLRGQVWQCPRNPRTTENISFSSCLLICWQLDILLIWLSCSNSSVLGDFSVKFVSLIGDHLIFEATLMSFKLFFFFKDLMVGVTMVMSKSQNFISLLLLLLISCTTPLILCTFCRNLFFVLSGVGGMYTRVGFCENCEVRKSHRN